MGERNIYLRVKRDATRKGRDFTITEEWFETICHEPCHYCGRIDQNRQSFRGGPRKDGTRKIMMEEFRFNGIDRVDNNKGYTPDNCVPCCIICNRAKATMTYDEFMAWINDLVGFRSSPKEPNVTLLLDNSWY